MKTPRRTAAIAACLALSLPAAAVAQESTTTDDVRAAIEDFRDGTLDDLPMTAKVRKSARSQKHKSRHVKRFKSFGATESVTFWETFDGADLYLVAFENARVVIALARNDAGEISRFRYRSVLITR